MIMDRQIRFATKNDFLYACVVLAMFVVIAVGLFSELAEFASMHSLDTTASRLPQPRST
jgi:hypothetical protein